MVSVTFRAVRASYIQTQHNSPCPGSNGTLFEASKAERRKTLRDKKMRLDFAVTKLIHILHIASYTNILKTELPIEEISTQKQF